MYSKNKRTDSIRICSLQYFTAEKSTTYSINQSSVVYTTGKTSELIQSVYCLYSALQPNYFTLFNQATILLFTAISYRKEWTLFNQSIVCIVLNWRNEWAAFNQFYLLYSKNKWTVFNQFIVFTELYNRNDCWAFNQYIMYTVLYNRN